MSERNKRKAESLMCRALSLLNCQGTGEAKLHLRKAITSIRKKRAMKMEANRQEQERIDKQKEWLINPLSAEDTLKSIQDMIDDEKDKLNN